MKIKLYSLLGGELPSLSIFLWTSIPPNDGWIRQ